MPEIFHDGERNAESFDVKQVICFDHFMAFSTGETNEKVRLLYIGCYGNIGGEIIYDLGGVVTYPDFVGVSSFPAFLIKEVNQACCGFSIGGSPIVGLEALFSAPGTATSWLKYTYS
ncbi:MAG: hypothetical protein VX603_00480 [Gemmatimonadota bacterium]|nr:hypothetical protein [Gemmatimonadota bacterium]